MQKLTADEAFEIKQYAIAEEKYKQQFEVEDKRQAKATLAFKAGLCSNFMADYKSSLRWFKKAYELDYGPNALEKYGYALKNNEEYVAAQEAFTQLLDEAQNQSKYRREISICKIANEWKKQKDAVKFEVEKSPLFENPGNDYAAVYHPDGDIYFSSDRFGSEGKEKYGWSGNFHSDLYHYNFKQREVQKLSGKINSAYNEGSCTFANNGTTIYFSSCQLMDESSDAFCQIYKSDLINDQWNEAEQLDLGNAACNNINPAIHSSDTVLIFSSDRELGAGNYDLYQSVFTKGAWTAPISLSNIINTEGNEKFPVWHKDTLFFASDGLAGFGGLDIFKTWFDSKGTWMPAQNMRWPINSGADDFSFTVNPSFVANESVFLEGLISSNREGGSLDEIYSFQLVPNSEFIAKKTDVKYTFEVFVNFVFYSDESYKVGGDKKQTLDSVQLATGVQNEAPIYSNAKNTIFLKVTPNDQFIFRASRKGYLNQLIEFTTPEIPNVKKDSILTIQIPVILTPFRMNEEFTIDDVFYDFDKWDLREASIRSLERIVKLLKSNPKINIEIGSHTDCRGEELYNQQLSERRAESVVNYLLTQDIPKEHLTYKGYGESKRTQLCSCEQCTEDEHQQNRRTTFRLIR